MLGSCSDSCSPYLIATGSHPLIQNEGSRKKKRDFVVAGLAKQDVLEERGF